MERIENIPTWRWRINEMIVRNELELEGTSPIEEQKSSELAQKFRQQGNQVYASCSSIEGFENAYAFYAQSIAHAPANSQELPLAYSNLSAVLFKLKKYFECLQAIDSSLNSGYPEGSKFKIYVRKIECLKIVDKQLEATKAYEEALDWIDKIQSEEAQKVELKKKLEDCYNKQVEVKRKITEEEVCQIWENFKIPKFNKEIPGTSSAIDLKYNEQFGRHFVAARDIRPGEILLREHPFVLVCQKDRRYNCCWGCLQSMKNCIPCDGCKNVIFCSEKCKEKAWKEYHQDECKLLSYYLMMPEPHFSKMIMAVRIFIRGIKEYKTVKRLTRTMDKMDKNDESSKNPRNGGFINEQMLGSKYRAFYSLYAHPGSACDNLYEFTSLSTGAVYQIAVSTTLLGRKFTPNWKWMHEDKIVSAASTLITRHQDIARTNIIKATPLDGSNHSGNCLSILGSLFNHSCVANAYYKIAKGYAEAMAILPIKKGEQIFCNYLGDTYYEREKRQGILESKYFFTCECVACKNDWPHPKQYPTLKDPNLKSKVKFALSRIKICNEFASFMDTEGQKNIELMNNNLKELSWLIKELVAKTTQPCAEIKDLQDTLLELFINVRMANV